MLRSLIIFLVIQLAACAQEGKTEKAWAITSVASPIVTEGVFAGNADMSGIASLDGMGCLLVSNETRGAQIGMLTSNPWRLKAGPLIPLIPPRGEEECDFESVAVDASTQFYYVLGSHGVSKKKGHPRPEQEALFRLPVEATTKLPSPVQVVPPSSVSLRDWLRRVPGIGESVGQPLQANGLSMEGLACREGKLFLGCRSPHREGKAAILEVEAAVLFSQAAESWPLPTVHWVPLGQGLGVRDLARVKGGFLILAGDAGVVPTPKFPNPVNYHGDRNFTLFLWKPEAPETVTRIGNLPEVKASAEGLLVLEETDASIKVLILHDGAYNGAPALFLLTKPGS